jgi:hypothetical protein
MPDFRRFLLPGAVLVSLLACLPVTARAQSGGLGNPARPLVPKAETGGKREAPPAALPGSRAEPTEVAPAERSAADLQPTDALFDAINRGDIVVVRDAISRGADLHGHNVLGLSPLDLAVDLGRNEISFLLLSLGAGNAPGGGGPPPEQQAVRAAPPPRAVQERPARLAATERTSSSTPRLFAGDGGAPVPQAGFLGFDRGR